MIVTGDHIGTHIDWWGHVKPDAPRAEGVPIDYCYGDGVVLDLTDKGPGEEITPGDIDAAERKLDGYQIKALDIVLLRTITARVEKRLIVPSGLLTDLFLKCGTKRQASCRRSGGSRPAVMRAPLS